MFLKFLSSCTWPALSKCQGNASSAQKVKSFDLETVGTHVPSNKDFFKPALMDFANVFTDIPAKTAPNIIFVRQIVLIRRVLETGFAFLPMNVFFGRTLIATDKRLTNAKGNAIVFPPLMARIAPCR